MNNSLLFYFLLLTIIQGCKQQEQKNIYILDETLSDVNQLDHFFKDKRIVFLGEPSHGDGTIFEARIEMIKYLHKFHDFNTLVFESNFYDAEIINALKNSGNLEPKHFKEATFDIWGNVSELDDLWDYIVQEKSLTFGGMDFQPHLLMRSHFIAEIEKIIDLPNSHTETLSRILQEISGTSIGRRKSTASEADLEILVTIKEQLSNNEHNENLILGINSILNYLELYNELPPKSFWSKHNFRDSIMFENLKLHTRDTNSKVIVWLASAHSLESPGHIIDTEDLLEMDASYKDYVPVGMLSKNAFKDSQFNIAFTGYKGAFRDFMDGENYDFKLDSLPTMEKAIISKTCNPTFLYLTHLDTSFYSGILGYEPLLADWKMNFDAVIIFPEVKPSTFK